MRPTTIFTAGLVALALGALAVQPARACDVGPPPAHVLDPEAQGNDHVAPALPPPSLFKINRGHGNDGCSSYDSCEGMAAVVISVSATDDATPAQEVGYRLTLVDGALPQDMRLPDSPIRTIEAGHLWLYWGDGDSDDQEAFSFTLQIVAIDLAGNESAPQTLEVADSGSGGCRVAGHAAPVKPGMLAVLLVALVARARRRRTFVNAVSCRDR
jgi:MYXO-CTERM domain-containing protein